MAVPMNIMNELLALTPEQKVEIVNHLLTELSTPDPEIDRLWKQETEKRLEEFKQGMVKTISLEKLIQQFESNQL